MKRDVVDSGFIVEMEKGFQAGSYTYGYKKGERSYGPSGRALYKTPFPSPLSIVM